MSRSLPIWTPAYVGLGSNLGDPPRQLRQALVQMDKLPTTQVVAVSSFYRNPPLGVPDQPDFVNAAAGLLTRLSAADLLAGLKAIETAQGRQRDPDNRWGPRLIDLDLLVYGAERSEEPGLVLPHSGITDRNFVLFPLLEIAPGLTIPGQGRLAQFAARVSRAGLECMA